MKKILAYKIVVNTDGILISCDECNPEVSSLLGYKSHKTEILLTDYTLIELRKLLSIHKGVRNVFWIERMLRKENGLKQIVKLLSAHRLKYKISAHTLCSA